ncbi:MAG: flagellar hook-associated protein FlgK [Gemmatimonadales bacterium]
MSLTSLLSIARGALLTQQKAIDVTGHNIANANTPGFSRQRLTLSVAQPLQSPIGQFGRGVTATGLERFRDQFLDQSFRTENGDLGRFTTQNDVLSEVERAFGEPSDTGLGAGLDQLFAAFGDLANDPTSPTARTLARQAGASLAQTFQDTDRRIASAATLVQSKLTGVVSDINEIARQIAQLNIQVQGTTSGGREAPDVKDQRDKLVDQLSGLTGVRVIPHNDGTIGVVAGDVLLVDAGLATTLEVRDEGNGVSAVGILNSSRSLNFQSGELAALTELSATTLPGLHTQLDALARGVVTEVNTLHAGGRTLSGATGVNFFDPTGLTAGSMQISLDVKQSTDNIAAGASGAPGDNAVALSIAALRSSGVASFGGQSLGESYQRLVADLGTQVRDSGRKQTAQDVVVTQADTLRQSVSGVSIDEEMTSLISQQNAYSAAAHLVNVADQMMQDILAMVR